MKRLGPLVVVSLAVHVLIFSAFWFLSSWHFDEAPLAGGGGGNGVTVEIVGGMGPIGQGGDEKTAPVIAPTQPLPSPKTSKTKNQMTVKTKVSDKAKPGRPDADNVPVGTPAPGGPGQGSGPPGPGSGDGGSNAALAQIRAKIERAKRYPMAARRMNMEGVSVVRFAIAGDGQPNGLALKTSSGYPLLDDEALATIRRAAPLPAYGDTLEIGIRFEIDK